MTGTRSPAGHEHEDTLTFKKSYEALARTFNPVKFNPQAVADLAEEAGTRYLVFCTKHHDGFCFWDTKTTDYKITSTSCPFHTNANANVTRALFDAFRNKSFWIGAYFSKPDWNVPYYWAPQFGAPTSRDPNYSPNEHPEVWKQFKDFTWAQIRELMSGLWAGGYPVARWRPGAAPERPGHRHARARSHGPGTSARTAHGGPHGRRRLRGLPDAGRHPRHAKALYARAVGGLHASGRRLGLVKEQLLSQRRLHHSLPGTRSARNGNLLLAVGPTPRASWIRRRSRC